MAIDSGRQFSFVAALVASKSSNPSLESTTSARTSSSRQVEKLATGRPDALPGDPSTFFQEIRNQGVFEL